MSWKDHYKEGGDTKRTKFFHTSGGEQENKSDGDQPLTAEKKEDEEDDDDDEFSAMVTAIVGDLGTKTVEHLKWKSKGNVEKAVNLYYDGSKLDQGNENEKDGDGDSAPGSSQNPIELEDEGDDTVVVNDNEGDEEDDIKVVGGDSPEALGLYKNWTMRYVGSFGALVWATRTGKNLVKIEEKLVVKREVGKAQNRLSKGKSVAPGDNIIVRLARERDKVEVARLSREDATFASVLMDSGLCEFRATVIFAGETVRVGGNIDVQIECFLNRSAFYSNMQLPPSLATTTKKQPMFSKESEDEKLMSMRQKGLVNLLHRIGLGDKKVQTTSMSDAAEMMGTQLPQQEETELSHEQLDHIYQRSETPDSKLDGIDPPQDTFQFELRPYQRKGLEWMVQKETKENDDDDDSGGDTQNQNNEPMHPLWRAISWPIQHGHVTIDKTADPDDSKEFYVNAYSGELSLNFPRQHKSVLGGVLADEMGLGKTISTMALVHSNKFQPMNDPDAGRSDYARHTTLVVAPMSLLTQWDSEVYASAKKSTMRTLIYYGSDSKLNLKSILCIEDANSVPDVVITSYGTLVSEHNALNEFLKSRKEDDDWKSREDLHRFGLFGVKFFRVVLDEGHNIRNRAAKTSKACCDLRASRRWVLTGTPIVNRLDDLYSIVKFLGVEPWRNYSFWKAFVSSPFENKSVVQAMHVVQSIMEPLVLRRTKDMKQTDGSPLVQLPPKTVRIHRVKFTEDETALYQYILARVRNNFKEKMEQGELLKSYTSLFAQILRLRQVCCHPALVWGYGSAANEEKKEEDDDDLEQVKAGGNEETSLLKIADKNLEQVAKKFSNFEQEDDGMRDASMYGSEVVKNILAGAEENCPLCLEPIPDDQQAVTECWHMACLDCLVQQITYDRKRDKQPKCATCRANISMDRIYQVKRQNGRVFIQRYHNRGQSSKVRELLNQLHELYRNPQSQDSVVRTVVFSQFTSYLTLIQKELEREGFACLRFDGTLTQKARAVVLDKFKAATHNVILLISLKAGGTGLNLVCANRAYLMDPWWSFAVESQAIDRIHRMGQLHEVQVTRFIMEDSVEERILKVQDKKMALAGTLGMSDEERRNERLQDMTSLLVD